MRGPLLVALLAVSLSVPAAGVSLGAATQSNPCVGHVEEPADSVTVISVQGAKMTPPDRGKRRAQLVGVGPRGAIRWVHGATTDLGVVWAYDVDPLANGNVFVTATRPGRTLFYELDPRTGQPVWVEEVGFVDTHDADLLDRHRILVANMRNYNATTGLNDDRILIYNRTSDEVAWEWAFREHGYPRDGGGSYDEDWTHVNDVDAVGGGRYLVSLRNFDQVIVVDRGTGEITARLGADGDHDVLKKQHNPQYLEGEDGRPTVLVADSENDRIVEYGRTPAGWQRTWELSGPFGWPRDADRLPDGNTLIVDSTNHRVIEVTPTGEVVWEVYTPWLVYDAERVRYGDEPGGPTIREQGAVGSYDLSGPAPWSLDALKRCGSYLREVAQRPTDTPTASSTPGSDPATATERPGDVTSPTAGRVISPTPGGTASPTDAGTPTTTPGFGALAALLAVLAAIGAAYRV